MEDWENKEGSFKHPPKKINNQKNFLVKKLWTEGLYLNNQKIDNSHLAQTFANFF